MLIKLLSSLYLLDERVAAHEGERASKQDTLQVQTNGCTSSSALRGPLDDMPCLGHRGCPPRASLQLPADKSAAPGKVAARRAPGWTSAAPRAWSDVLAADGIVERAEMAAA